MRWACILLPQLALDHALRQRDDPQTPLALLSGPTNRRVLLALTCPQDCAEQRLIGIDARTEERLWEAAVPIDMSLAERAADLRRLARPDPDHGIFAGQAGKFVAVDAGRCLFRRLVRRVEERRHVRCPADPFEARLVGEKDATGWQRAGGSISGKRLSATVEALAGG